MNTIILIVVFISIISFLLVLFNNKNSTYDYPYFSSSQDTAYRPPYQPPLNSQNQGPVPAPASTTTPAPAPAPAPTEQIITTTAQRPDEFILKAYGVGFDMTKLSSTPTKLITSYLWSVSPNWSRINNTLGLNFDYSSGAITGLNTSSLYFGSISMLINTAANNSQTVSTYPSNQSITITLGVGVTASGNNVTKIDASERTIKATSSRFTAGTSIRSNTGVPTNIFFPYIYIDDASKLLLSGKTNCYADITLTVRKIQ
jgi:hypothetical protein